MFWSLDSVDEQSFGQLISSYRRRRGLNQADVAPLLARFGFRFPPQLSLLEGGTWQTRPERALIQELSRLYTLSPREESFLLRQANIPPSATEQQSVIMRFGATMLEFSSPTCVINLRWQLVAWNEAFAELYDGSENLRTQPSRLQGHAAPLQAASRPLNMELGSSSSPPSAVSNRSRSAHIDAPLLLEENLSFLIFLFSRSSKLRGILEPDEWSKLAQFFLIRFWRTTLPMFNQHWYPGGEPPWVVELEDSMRLQPVPEREEFFELSSRIRQVLESDGGWADPHNQLLNNFLHDRLLFRQLGAQFQVTPSVMADARFLFVLFQRIDGPEPLTPALHNLYL